MDKKDIQNFTLKELLSQTAGSDAVFYEGCLIGHSSPREGAELLRHPIRIDAHLICLCRHSGGEMMANLKRLDMKRNTLVAIPPGNVICIDDSALDRNIDMDMTVFAFTPEFLDKINLDIKPVVPLIGFFKETSCIELSDKEMSLLEHTLESVRAAIGFLCGSRFYHEIVRRIIESAHYMIVDVISRHTRNDEHPEAAAPKKRNDEYFARFVKCLYENYKTERSVAFYAAQLHITPKYLTTLIRSASGRTAAEWIDEYVILEAKNLLRYSNMSIQEVAYSLNFSNQSFFGKYFKHHTGISPSQYKRQK